MNVAITGVTGSVGNLLANRLGFTKDIDKIVGIGRKREDEIGSFVSDVSYRSCSINSPELSSHFEGIDSVVHLAWVVKQTTPERDYTIDIEGSQNVIDACEKTGVKNIVFLSSNKVYGFRTSNEDRLREEPFSEEDPVIRDGQIEYIQHKITAECLFFQYAMKRPEKNVSILRAATIVGPNTDTPLTRALTRKLLVSLREYNPLRQFIHEDDAARALIGALTHGARGTYNVTADDAVRQKDIHQYMGNIPFSLPTRFCERTLGLLHRVGVSDYDAKGLDFIKHSVISSNDKIKRELGWKPHYTSAQALQTMAR